MYRSTASTESAATCLRALGWPWVAAWQAPEDAAVALRSPFQPITRLWQFEGLSVKHGPSDRFAPEPDLLQMFALTPTGHVICGCLRCPHI